MPSITTVADDNAGTHSPEYAARAARSLDRESPPTVRVWWGPATGKYLAVVVSAAGRQRDRLLEAATPAEMHAAIRSALAWPS